jgi:hypothetical protein
VAGKAQHAFGDAQVLGVADQRNGLKRMGHTIPCSMTVPSRSRHEAGDFRLIRPT